jgi:alkanesulfonate monooxygenase SsuD/methylene tetrahydromethanopterin reductase-like flavin-dependent oxidoreductase (luciferase family)
MTEARAQVAWYPAFIGRHVANILRSHDIADAGSDIWGYIDDTSAGEYRQRGAPGERPAVAVPDEVIDRVTIIGDPTQTVSRVRELESLGVTEVAIYLSSDEPHQLIEAYGREVIPACAASGV